MTSEEAAAGPDSYAVQQRIEPSHKTLTHILSLSLSLRHPHVHSHTQRKEEKGPNPPQDLCPNGAHYCNYKAQISDQALK